jgi:hypothetical protein
MDRILSSPLYTFALLICIITTCTTAQKEVVRLTVGNSVGLLVVNGSMVYYSYGSTVALAQFSVSNQTSGAWGASTLGSITLDNLPFTGTMYL